MPRIALVHALQHSLQPINEAMARLWPQARCMNLLDDSLSSDLARSGALDDAMTQRFCTLADYAVAQGADAILFTCSAFGLCIDAVKQRHLQRPVLKPNEAMVDEAVALATRLGTRVGLVASFAPTLSGMPLEFPAASPPLTALADGALQALNAGDTATHDRLVVDAAAALAGQGCGVIALAQFSMARAAAAVATRSGLPVVTTVDSAVRRLQAELALKQR